MRKVCIDWTCCAPVSPYLTALCLACCAPTAAAILCWLGSAGAATHSAARKLTHLHQPTPAISVCYYRCVQEVGESLKHISDVGRRWMGWTDSQNKDQQLAAQQELLDRAGHFGQLLGLVVMGLVALRAGRLWDVHQVSSQAARTTQELPLSSFAAVCLCSVGQGYASTLCSLVRANEVAIAFYCLQCLLLFGLSHHLLQG